MNLFISGSRAIDRFDENITYVLFEELNSNVKILVGDADGVDAEIQRFAHEMQYKNVTVFATNGKARNNIGNFPVKNVRVDNNVYYKNYFVQKDIAMTDAADYGIIIWDGKSKGSLNNIYRLIRQNKPCQVYLANQKKWVMLESENDIKKSVYDKPVKQDKAAQLSFF